jgi:glycosyltransferase involved in cell wall biosynthesis
VYRCCVLTPFYGRLDQVERLVANLLPQCPDDTAVLLINDGGDQAEVEQLLLAPDVSSQLHLLHHNSNLGVAAARNTGIQWCREQGVELLLMVDSDCLVPADFVSAHQSLHEAHPQAACFGCGVEGTGQSVWAKLDKIVSWVHSVPAGEIKAVPHPYHLPTTNFSLKLSAVADMAAVFDSRLNTGEDALLIRHLRRQACQVWFSPQPVIQHADREQLVDVIKHQYVWGHHQYFVQLNNDLSPRAFNPLFRLLFLLFFIPCLPLYALMGATLNVLPWFTHKPAYLLAFPAVYLVWLAKACAVAEAAIRPYHCLRAEQL